MKFYILQREYDSLIGKLSEFKKEKEQLGKEMAEIMETSGSFTGNTPGFNETEQKVKHLENKITDSRNFLDKSVVVKDLSELDPDEITVYSRVSAFDIDAGKNLSYYIQYELPGKKSDDCVIVTPFSPIGSCLIGKKTGDKIDIKLPSKTLRLKILEIEKKTA